jgi:hypothetical protein
MERMVFVPLGMADSSYIWRESYIAQHAFSHSNARQMTGQNKSTQHNAAASLRTTAQDFGKFLVAIANGKGLKRTTQRQMLTPQIQVSESGTNNTARPPEKLSASISWGLGWGLQKTEDGMAYWHWGDNGNMKAYVVMYDKQQFGLVVFTNGANGLKIVPEIIDESLGGQQPALNWLKYGSYKNTNAVAR